jgi:F0F1-type ATP synthase assembly protein I
MPKNDEPVKPPLFQYARYSSLAFQMLVVILAGVFGGLQLDRLLNLKYPVFTVLLSLLSVILAIYQAIRDLIKPRGPSPKKH